MPAPACGYSGCGEPVVFRVTPPNLEEAPGYHACTAHLALVVAQVLDTNDVALVRRARFPRREGR